MALAYCSGILLLVGHGLKFNTINLVHLVASPADSLARSLALERLVDLVPVVAQPRAPGGCLGPPQPGPVGAGEDLVCSAQVLSSSPCGWPRQWPVCDPDCDSQGDGLEVGLGVGVGVGRTRPCGARWSSPVLCSSCTAP